MQASPETLIPTGVVLVRATNVSTTTTGGVQLLDDVSVEVRAGELVALVGASGAGKSTLLETLAGLRRPTTGSVEHGSSARIGFVPQDDIVHAELSVSSTVRYAARLRLPPGTPGVDVDAAVDRTLAVLGLDDRRGLTVASLSGGQRKRVSIATELVVEPDTCFLDEPTSGLDPLAAASLMTALRALADTGTAVVVTTHNLADLHAADRVLVLEPGGRVVFDGDPAAAPLPHAPGRSIRAVPSAAAPRRSPPTATTARAGFDQLRVLARRNVELMIRNRMSLAIMAGSPVLIVAMFAVLFRSGSFGTDGGSTVGVVYWMAFAGFFFGLTFGLLQIVTELAVVRRERFVAVDVGPYVLAKVAVLLPALLVVDAVLAGTLLVLDRLEVSTGQDVATLLLVLLVDSFTGLTLGLLASAAVSTAAQAALALPLLCFPAVLFSGAVLPVRSMAPVGRAIAAATSDRWAFEAVGRTLGLERYAGRSGTAAIDAHGAAFSGAITGPTLTTLALGVAFALGAAVVLARRTSPR